LRIINKYIAGDFLVAFALTVSVITFVMCVGAMVRAIDYFARGVSGIGVIEVFLYNIPYLLTFSIPVGTLITILLQFGRMSFDGEINAMKACGLSMWQIASPAVMISIVLSFFCVYLNDRLAPQCFYRQRQVLARAGMVDPISLLEEGRFIKDFPGLMVYVAKKKVKQVEDIVAYEMDDKGIVRNVRAKSGQLSIDRTNGFMLIDLYDVRIDQPDRENPLDPTRARYLTAQHYPVKVSFAEMLKKGIVHKTISDMTYADLIDGIRNIRGMYPGLSDDALLVKRMILLVEANKRLSMSLACFAFTLLGVPLGLISRRKESSVGIGISILVAFFFYFFLILGESMVERPYLHPDLIVWLPVVLVEVAGFLLLIRVR